MSFLTAQPSICILNWDQLSFPQRRWPGILLESLPIRKTPLWLAFRVPTEWSCTATTIYFKLPPTEATNPWTKFGFFSCFIWSKGMAHTPVGVSWRRGTDAVAMYDMGIWAACSFLELSGLALAQSWIYQFHFTIDYWYNFMTDSSDRTSAHDWQFWLHDGLVHRQVLHPMSSSHTTNF